MLPAGTRTVTATAERVSPDWRSMLRADGVPATGNILGNVKQTVGRPACWDRGSCAVAVWDCWGEG